MKRKSYVIYLDISTIAGEPETITTQLTQVLCHIWDEIHNSIFESPIDSMLKRVEAVIDAKGWDAKYWRSKADRYQGS